MTIMIDVSVTPTRDAGSLDGIDSLQTNYLNFSPSNPRINTSSFRWIALLVVTLLIVTLLVVTLLWFQTKVTISSVLLI
jgi:hypothetical protein